MSSRAFGGSQATTLSGRRPVASIRRPIPVPASDEMNDSTALTCTSDGKVPSISEPIEKKFSSGALSASDLVIYTADVASK